MKLINLKKTLLIVIVFLLISQIATAIEINFDPETVVIKDTQKQFPISIKNNDSSTIFNITAITTDSFITVQPIQSLTQNSSGIINISIKTTEAFQKQVNVTIQFNKIVQTNAPITTQDVIVDTTVLTPNNVTVTINSKIKWKTGNPANSFTVKKSDGSETLTIPANSFVEKTFSDILVYDYFIQENGFLGKVTAISDIIDVFSHDPNDDKNIKFTINSQNTPSSLSLENLITNLTMDYNKKEQGAIRFLTNGSVFKLKMTQDPTEPISLIFSNNNFDFNGSKIVTFDVVANGISQANQTNKTYKIKINAISDNTENTTSEISVFINPSIEIVPNTTQSNVSITLVTDEMLTAFCAKFPQKCPTSTQIQQVFIEKNTTEVELLAQLNDRTQRFENREKLRDDTFTGYNTKFTELTSKIEAVTTKTQEIDTFVRERFREKQFSTTFYIIILVIIGITISGIVGFRFFRKYQASKESILR